MRFAERFLLIALSFSLAVSTCFSTQAQVLSSVMVGRNAVTEIQRGWFSRYIFDNKKLADAGISELRVVQDKGAKYLIGFGSDGAKKMTLVFNNASKETLEQFKPSVFNRFLHSKMGRVSVSPYTAAKRFPMESFSFFVTLGSLAFVNLLANYHKNPLAIEQWFDGQMDPLGQFSFYLFMVASSACHGVFDEIVKHRSIRHFMPYICMSSGMTASHMFHDVSAVMKECWSARYNKSPNRDMICDKAYTEWKTSWQEPDSFESKMNEYGFGILSLVISTVLSGVGQRAILQTGATALHVMGLNVLLNYTPSGRAGRWGVVIGRSMLQAGIFNAAIEAVDPFLRVVWDNKLVTGPQVWDSSYCLGLHLKHMLAQSEGKGELYAPIVRTQCDVDMAKVYKRFQQLMIRFRTENMTPVVMMQQSWEGYLAEFVNRHRESKHFYGYVLETLRDQKNEEGAVNPLDAPMPLFGVKPETNIEFSWSMYLESNAAHLLRWQRATIKKFSAKLDALVQDPAMLRFKAHELSFLREIATLLRSGQDNLMGQGFEKLGDAAGANGEQKSRLGRLSLSPEFVKILATLHQGLGAPSPKWSGGEGFMTAWVLNRSESTEVTKAEPGGGMSSFPTRIRSTSTPLNSEFMLASMVFGPEVRDTKNLLAVNGWGFRSVFNPPRLIPNSKVYLLNDGLRLTDWEDKRADDSTKYETIYTRKIWIDSDPTPGCSPQKPTCFKPLIQWIRDGHFRKEFTVVPGKDTGLNAWWDREIQPSYLNTWMNFEVQYEGVIREFLKVFYGENRNVKVIGTDINIPFTQYYTDGVHALNSSGAKNAVIENLHQEREVALVMLSLALGGDEFKVENKHMDLGALMLRGSKDVPILKQVGNRKTPWPEKVAQYEARWQEAADLFLRLHIPPSLVVKNNQGEQKFASRLPNQSLVQRYEELSKLLDHFDAVVAEEEKKKTVQPNHLKLAKIALKSLRNSHEELLDYGLIVNSVSYVEKFEDMNSPVFRRCIRTKHPQSTNPFMKRPESPSCL